MQEVPTLVSDLALILCVAGVVMLLCQKLKQPLVLGYLLAGMIIGPHTLPFISITNSIGIHETAELGVIFLMFSLGLEFSFHKLKKMGGPASITGFFEVVFMLFVGYFLGIVLGWSKIESVFLGAALSISSTTIIIKALAELRLKKTHFAHLVFGVLIVEDLLAILLLVGLSSLAFSTNAFGSGMLLKAALRLILVVGGWFLIGYFIVPTMFRRWLNHASDELVMVVSVGLCLLLVNLALYFHYSAALGAFIMGSILAETEKSHRIENLVQPLRDLFAAVFFVSVGMLINPVLIWTNIGTILLITAVTIVGKVLSSFLGALFSREHPLTAIQVGFSMAQIGEFSFIITSLGVAMGLLDPAFYPIIVAVSVITTFTTPYLIQLSSKSSSYIEKRWYKNTDKVLFNQEQSIHIEKKQPEKYLHAKGYFSRIFVNAIVVALVLIFAQRFIWPLAIQLLTPLVTDEIQLKIIILLVTYLLCAPFIFAMLFACELTAYMPRDYSRVILNLLASIMVFVELYWLLNPYFYSRKSLAFFILGLMLLSVIFKNFLQKIYRWFERRLIGNLKKPEQIE